MSATYNHYHFNAPHLLDRQHIAQQRAISEAWEQYECEVLPHVLTFRDDVKMRLNLTRKQAAERNAMLRGVGSAYQWKVSKVEEIETESEQNLPF
jgi:hypothetical protein